MDKKGDGFPSIFEIMDMAFTAIFETSICVVIVLIALVFLFWCCYLFFLLIALLYHLIF